VIVRGVWRFHAPWCRPDHEVVIDAPADDHQRNQDQDDVGHLNACDHGRDEPDSATMATTPKPFSPVRRTDVSYPRTTQLRGGCLIYFHRDVYLRPLPDEVKTDEETIA
jgi:hypothetical protein